MDCIQKYFGRHPSQMAVARLLLSQGLSVHDGYIWCGDIRQADTSVAEAAKVDRRVVRSAVERIMGEPELLALYSKLRCMVLLSDVAKELGCSVIEVIPTDEKVPGIMSGIMDIIFKAGINVKQAVVSEPADDGQSHLILITEGEMPGTVISAVRESFGVASVIIR
ncbi:MAG: regulator of amino acid metabolism, contains ACT domain protein [Candidatus Methanomethylophilus sp.]|nr:regulator of amino acid metabolism, contains ACT domain protein [Methanomethylophilus sp.]MCI2093832.1 regulator of amino acid metabolism, contains ACT domain protein [Methanomethylophilus sp.]